MTEEFGNASSMDHSWGDRAEEAVKRATKQVAELVGSHKREIVWTSGATESINLAIQGSLSPNPGKPHRIALLPVEHKAVLDTCHILEKRGWAELVYLQVDSTGRLNLNHLEQVCAEGLSLVCVMAANNEIGNIYPIEAIALDSLPNFRSKIPLCPSSLNHEFFHRVCCLGSQKLGWRTLSQRKSNGRISTPLLPAFHHS